MDVTPYTKKEIQNFRPEESAMKIHTLEAAEKIALKIKDYAALEKAMDDKLEEQALFAANYKVQFQAGNPHSNYASTGVIKPKDYCLQFGFSLRTVQRWAESLLDPEKKLAEVERRKSFLISVCNEEATDNIALKLTGNVEWYTPPEYIESARTVMGGIDTDPASNDFAQNTVKAETYYTIDNNGLDQEWYGNVWLNPPYSAQEIKQFIDKLMLEFGNGNVTQAILLTNNNTDTSWWHKSVKQCGAVCFTDGRISFYNDRGKSSSPTNGQNFIYFGDNVDGFDKEFSQHGMVMVTL